MTKKNLSRKKDKKIKEHRQRQREQPALPGQSWYRLDNAAKIYPATMNRNWNSIYRMSATLGEDVDPELLRRAVDDLRQRFPAFFVQLRQGFFWYYFEPAASSDVVFEEDDYPCRPIDVGRGNRPLFRVLYYKKRISVEVFHAVTDGTGAMVFLKALLSHYFALCGYDMEGTRFLVPNPKDDPPPAEAEDSFEKYYAKGTKKSRREQRAYSCRTGREDERFLRVIAGRFSVEELKKLTKEKGATITQYLTALYILAFASCIGKNPGNRPVKISVPVNLRQFFPSETMRNFSLYTNVGIAPFPGMTLDDVLKAILPQMAEGFDRENLRAGFSENVRLERSPALRIAPLGLKNIALKAGYKLYGENLFTSPFSNLGPVDFPAELGDLVKEAGFLLGVSPANPIACTGLSVGGRMTVTFTSSSADSSVQSFFFRYLAEQGVDVEVESNV